MHVTYWHAFRFFSELVCSSCQRLRMHIMLTLSGCWKTLVLPAAPGVETDFEWKSKRKTSENWKTVSVETGQNLSRLIWQRWPGARVPSLRRAATRDAHVGAGSHVFGGRLSTFGPQNLDMETILTRNYMWTTLNIYNIYIHTFLIYIYICIIYIYIL